MNKKHFIILGNVGIIYYSWLLIVLFLSLIITYESTKTINWSAIAWEILFIFLVIYTFLTSYWKGNIFKLPFKGKIQLESVPQINNKWHCFSIYVVKIDNFKKYHLLRIERR